MYAAVSRHGSWMDALVGSRVSPKSNAGGLEVTVSRSVALWRIEPGEPGSMAVLAGRPPGPASSCQPLSLMTPGHVAAVIAEICPRNESPPIAVGRRLRPYCP